MSGTDLPKISDEMVKMYRDGWNEPPIPTPPAERVRAGLAAVLAASGYRREVDVLREVADEMARQDARWGEQNHPDGTGLPGDAVAAAIARTVTDHAAQQGRCTWRKILAEEVFEAFAETDPAALRAELVQVEAVAAQWRLAIDRRDRATALEQAQPLLAAGSEVESLEPVESSEGQERSEEQQLPPEMVCPSPNCHEECDGTCMARVRRDQGFV